MESICKLAQEKGFKAKTVSTSVTLKYHLGEGKNLLINDTCNYLLLAEIQKWLRELNTPRVIIVTTDFVAWEAEILNPDKEIIILTKNKEDKWFDSYEEALIAGIKETLENEKEI